MTRENRIWLVSLVFCSSLSGDRSIEDEDYFVLTDTDRSCHQRVQSAVCFGCAVIIDVNCHYSNLYG